MSRVYRTPRQRAIRRDIKNACLLWAIVLPFIVMLGVINYAEYSAQVCRDVPNHYTCTGAK